MRLFCLLQLVLLVALPLLAAPLATFEAKERLDLDWAPTLVTYPISCQAGQAKVGELKLVDADGAEMPFQLSRVAKHADGSLATARISFTASLKKGGAYTYQLLSEKPAQTPAPLAVEHAGPLMILGNGLVAIRLPAAGTVNYPQPQALSNDHAAMTARYGKPEAGVAPGPLQGIKLANGAWVGGSYLYASNAANAPKVTGYTSELLEQGPLFTEARVRYTFDNGAFYQCTFRVLANDPAVRVDEQSDFKVQGPEYDLRAVFSLSGGGWQPNTAYFRTNEGRLSGTDPTFTQAVSTVGFDPKPYQGRDYGSTALTYTEPYKKIFDTAVWYPWHPNAYYFGLADTRQMKEGADKAGLPFVGVVPMHAGTWRGAIPAFNGMVFTHQAGDVALHWPLIAARHPNSLLHTGEYDPALPLSFIRRQWALVAGPMQYHDTLLAFRTYQGYINLDDYKDWALEWPDDPEVTYPRLVFSKKDVERLAPKLDTHPGGATLKKFLYFNDDAARYTQLWKGLTYNSCWSGPYGVAVHGLRNEGWISSFRYAQMCGWAGNADELLSSEHMTPEQRIQFRAYLAAACYVMSNPDFNPRGAMVHLGNPNMPINRFLGLTFTAALIPDHPRAKEWLDVSAEYVRYKLAMNTAPGGGWSELLSYYAASAPHIMQASNVLQQTGRLPKDVARLAALPGAFPMYLMSPRDPRFDARMLPLWGHEGTGITTQWLPVAGFIRDLDPELATAMTWAWEQGGRPMQEHHDAGFSERAVLHTDLLEKLKPGQAPAAYRSTWIPGIGAALRAHAGDPNETYMSYRQGYMISHCDANQGDFVLYSKGAPLVALNLFAYPLHQHDPYIKLNSEFGWYSHVRLGARTNTGGTWNDTSEIHAYGFSDSVDYLRGAVVYGQTRWSRQIAFLKGKSASGPNYFLFRDSFDPTGNAPLPQTWWYIRNPAAKDAVTATGNGLRYASPQGVTLDVRFLQPEQVAVETRDETRTGPLYFGGAYNWQRAWSPVVSGKDQSISVQEVLSVSAAGPISAGQDVMVVLYPQGKDEALPQYQVLAPGVVKVATSEGTDVIFLDRKPFEYTQGDISFKGISGAIRFYKDEVHLVISEGPGEVTYKGVTLKSPVPATRVLPVKGWRKRTITVPTEKTFISLVISNQVPVEEVQPGVTKEVIKDSVVYTFNSPTPLNYDQNGVRFAGKRGRVTVNDMAKTVKFEMVEGESIGYQNLRAWGCDGPYELTFHPDRVTGRYAGLGRFLNVTQPAGLDRLPMYVLDGQTFAPGTAGTTAILPLMPGEHRFELKALPQPPIWRNSLAWE